MQILKEKQSTLHRTDIFQLTSMYPQIGGRTYPITAKWIQLQNILQCTCLYWKYPVNNYAVFVYQFNCITVFVYFWGQLSRGPIYPGPNLPHQHFPGALFAGARFVRAQFAAKKSQGANFPICLEPNNWLRLTHKDKDIENCR